MLFMEKLIPCGQDPSLRTPSTSNNFTQYFLPSLAESFWSKIFYNLLVGLIRDNLLARMAAFGLCEVHAGAQ